MRVLLVGHGGREVALAWRISQSPTLGQLIVTGLNPGWPDGVVLVVTQGVEALVALVIERAVDLVVVGPEAPLQAGLADALANVGVACFGPTQAAAELEISKEYAKVAMIEAGVPTAGYLVAHSDNAEQIAAARQRAALGSVVVKADGLAAGKGVFVCQTGVEALAALDEVLGGRFGAAGERILLEDLLVGPEVSVFGLCDGTRVVGLPSSQDHKALYEGNRGPNTGGMGAYAPCDLVNSDEVERVLDLVHRPVVRLMAERGTPFRGVLYAGLMLTSNGPRVLEFNVRFGDPECQPLMSLWQDDILPWLMGAAKGNLPDGKPAFADSSACCVVLASRGYPATSEKGVPIPEPVTPDGVQVYLAGAQRGDDGVLRTNGGRVLGVTAVGTDRNDARSKAYAAVPGWRFDGSQIRTDIGAAG